MACRALETGKCLQLHYDGHVRVVEVHAVGLTPDNKDVMRVWQVRGGGRSGSTGWKLMRLDGARLLHLTDEPSQAPRPGYNPRDGAMLRIRCRL